MIKLFPTLDDLKPFIFRITDNGGESGDRFTVITCDGDYYAMSAHPFDPQGIGMTGEGVDVAALEERVEAGVERDLRWIDLPADCQRCVWDGLNQGFEDYISGEPVAPSRDAAIDYQGWSDWQHHSDRALRRGEAAGPVTPIYRDGDLFKVRRDDNSPEWGGDGDPEFATFVEAFRYTLPEDYDLSGPEYHTGVDLWDAEGDPAPFWDRDEEPPVIDEGNKFARVVIVREREGIEPDEQLERIAWFATVEDAENFLGTSATIDPDDLEAGRYTIDNLDDPDAE